MSNAATEVVDVVGEVFGFLVKHQDLIMILKEALDGGATSARLAAAMKKELVAISDKQMHEELGQ